MVGNVSEINYLNLVIPLGLLLTGIIPITVYKGKTGVSWMIILLGGFSSVVAAIIKIF